MVSLDVCISKNKSLISKTGCFEFAKRFVIRNGTLDLSPVSMRMIAALVNSNAVAPVLKLNGSVSFGISNSVSPIVKRP